MKIKKLHSRVWKRLKTVFNVPRYNEIPCIKFADAKDILGATKKINGGLNGILEREEFFNELLN